MDAITLLSQHIDVEKIMEHYGFDHIKQDGKYIRSCCKLHGGSNPTAFVVNSDNGLWFCHRCGEGGDAYTLVQKLEKIDFAESVKWIASFFNVDIGDLLIIERKQEYVDEMKTWIRFMKSRKKEETTQFNITVPLRDVTKFRSFNEETLAYFGLKYVEEFEAQRSDGHVYTLRNRLLIPIHNEHGVQIGVSMRATRSSDVPKWSHQPREIKTSNMLYNFDRVKNEPIIAISEGIFDVWAWYEIGVPAVCTYGAHLSDEQYRMLMKSGADLVLAYDGDDAGRTATRKAEQRFKNKCNLSIVDFLDGQDPESITREELQYAFFNLKKR